MRRCNGKFLKYEKDKLKKNGMNGDKRGRYVVGSIFKTRDK